MPEASYLTLLCPAKVNLALSVGAPDPAAGGLHPIASWMVAVDFADTLALRAIDAGPSRLRRASAPDAARAEPIDWPLEHDLAWRAHQLLESQAGRALPIDAALTKRIPTGAGLGGGSSDAAAMLVGVNRLFHLRLDAAALRGLAAKLGLDVIFLAAALDAGMTGALVTDAGQTIEPAPPVEPIHLVLIFPPHHCATGPVYRAFDALAPAAAVDAARVRALIGPRALDPAALFNDLAPAAMRVTPALRAARDAVRDAVGRPVHITGSGAAMFVLAGSAGDAAELAQRVIRGCHIPAMATVTRGSG